MVEIQLQEWRTMTDLQLLEHQQWLIEGWQRFQNPRLAEEVTIISNVLLARVRGRAKEEEQALNGH